MSTAITAAPWRAVSGRQLSGLPGLEPGTRVYQREVEDGHLTLLASRGSDGWHLSISHRSNRLVTAAGLPAPGRYPTWDEIAQARYQFAPDDVTMALLLPPRAEYVNVMPTCFHLWEIDK